MTQEQNRVVAVMQALFLVMGIILILIGAIRISFESDTLYDIYTKQIGTYFIEHPDSPILSAVFSVLDDSTNEGDGSATDTETSTINNSGAAGGIQLLGFFSSFTFLVISSIIAIGGFGLIWCAVALGAKEPPAWHAGRHGLVALIGVMNIGIIAVLAGRPSLLRFVAPPRYCGHGC
jgi:hypothetical protein